MTQLQQAMREHGEYCLRVAYLYVKDWNAAEEIVQDVFYAYSTQQNFQGASSLKTYLVKITVHKSQNYLRSWKAKKRQWFPSHEVDQVVASIEQDILQKEQKQQLVDLLFQLPVKYREVLILFYYDSYSIQEIAGILSLKENTVKTRLARARALLKPLLKKSQMEVLQDDEVEREN